MNLIGSWIPASTPPVFAPKELAALCARCREPLIVIHDPATRAMGAGIGGRLVPGSAQQGGQAYGAVGILPALYPEWLGDRSFLEVHGVRFPYVAGEMAHGIAGPELVTAMARSRMLGFYGAGGVAPERMEAAIVRLAQELGPQGLPWGANLIHTPTDLALEDYTAGLYLRHDVTRVCASAYMRLTPAVVRYSASGLTSDSSGRVLRRNRLFAKLSRLELAQLFLSPAPADIVRSLAAEGKLSPAEAELSQRVPVAEDITVEADSGGHTDNRPMVALLPAVAALRDELVAKYGYTDPIRVGAGGGIATPASVAAAFAMGAAYVLTGTINQAAVEASTSVAVKQMLAEAGLADVTMAPSPDMFEMGVRVQVLKRGVLFPGRAGRLYDLYTQYASIEQIPTDIREKIEREIFQRPLAQVWEETEKFFAARNPVELERAARDPKYKMALVFRWYVGQSSHWAISGNAARKADYQIWCGPAMGAFNAWAKGSFLQDPANRSAVQIALNLLEGGAVVTRANQLRSYGLPVPAEAFTYRPQPLQAAAVAA